MAPRPFAAAPKPRVKRRDDASFGKAHSDVDAERGEVLLFDPEPRPQPSRKVGNSVRVFEQVNVLEGVYEASRSLLSEEGVLGLSPQPISSTLRLV